MPLHWTKNRTGFFRSFQNRRKKIITLLLLLTFCAIILFWRPEPKEDRASLFGILSTVFVPVVSLFDLLTDNITDSLDKYYALISVHEQNKLLKKRISRFEKENRRLEEYKYENERLQKLLDFKDEFDLKTMPARVIGRDATHWFQSVLINVGARDKIRKNLAVVSNEGVIGHIVEVGPYYSKVQLIIDKSSGVSVLLQRTRDMGIMAGGGENQASIKYLLNNSDVKEGDLILTSGLGTVYPRGLPVGYVLKVTRDDRNLFLGVKVTPIVDFSKLSEVLVVLNQVD